MNRSFQNSYEHTEMRPPRSADNADASAGYTGGLSVNAKEFVPKNKQQQQQSFGVNQLQQPMQQLDIGNNPMHPHRPHLNGHNSQQQSSPSTPFFNNNKHHNSNQLKSSNQHHQHQQQQHYQQQQQQQHHQHSHNNHHHHQQHPHQQQQQQHQGPRPSVNNRLNRSSNQHHSEQQQQQHGKHQQYSGDSSNSMGGSSGYNNHQQYESNSGSGSGSGEPSKQELNALNLLDEVINKVVNDPGMFETYQREVSSIYREFSSNMFVLSNAIEAIFVQAVTEANFRYPGARLCRLLDTLDCSADSLFRYLLKFKLSNQHQENHNYLNKEAQKVRGTLLFLAELYIQLQQTNGQREQELANSIIETILLLLKKATPENIKHICQTLKLCGFELEMDCRDATKNILLELENISTNIDNSTNRLIKSVLDLRSNQWGRGNESILPMPIAEGAVQVFNNDPVFYGPDGQILTEEESKFLSDIENIEELDGGDSDLNELYEPEPEMDLEIQLAFKEFLWGCQSSSK